MDKIRETLPDLILLDVVLPGMNGLDICKTIKANKDFKNIPVIFIAEKVEPDDIEAGFEAGCAEYISKPFNVNEVCSRIRTQILVADQPVTRDTTENQAEFAKMNLLLVDDNPVNIDVLKRSLAGC